jgi:small subunit ribosomal protein S8
MNDQIADLLTRIRNASMAGRYEVTISYSKIKEAILKILLAEGFISSMEITEEDAKKSITAVISQSKTPSHLRQLSRPGKRVYVKNKEIPMPLRGLGTVIVSTSTGITTGKNARKSGVGGELICEIW